MSVLCVYKLFALRQEERMIYLLCTILYWSSDGKDILDFMWKIASNMASNTLKKKIQGLPSLKNKDELILLSSHPFSPSKRFLDKQVTLNYTCKYAFDCWSFKDVVPVQGGSWAFYNVINLRPHYCG